MHTFLKIYLDFLNHWTAIKLKTKLLTLIHGTNITRMMINYVEPCTLRQDLNSLDSFEWTYFPDKLNTFVEQSIKSDVDTY